MDGFASAPSRRNGRRHSAPVRLRGLCIGLVAWAVVAFCCESVQAQGLIQSILDEVRGSSSSGATEERAPAGRSQGRSGPSEGDDSSLCEPVFTLSFDAATSPFWLPCALLGDTYDQAAFFPRFPYDNVSGHLAEDLSDRTAKFWSGRLQVDYLEPFADTSGVSARLLLSTTSRLGLDAAMEHFEEHGAPGGPDRLTVGDCNLVFRFAQAERAEFRAGVGFNWLVHPDEGMGPSDFGFNFTYGADFFPRKPWVLSADLDAGNLGHAELFRFRATGGVMLRSVEIYTGYEYLDIGRTQFNMLLAGVRAWF